MRQVEIDHRLAVYAEVVLVDNFEDRPRRYVAGNEIAVFWIPLFKEVPALTRRNRLWITLIARSLRNPYASTFAAGRFRHQAQFVFAGNRRGMNLNELAVGVEAALLVERRLCRPGANHGVRRLAKDRSNAPGRDDDRVSRERPHFHRAQVHRAD